jgi:hypothetical protein
MRNEREIRARWAIDLPDEVGAASVVVKAVFFVPQAHPAESVHRVG